MMKSAVKMDVDSIDRRGPSTRQKTAVWSMLTEKSAVWSTLTKKSAVVDVDQKVQRSMSTALFMTKCQAVFFITQKYWQVKWPSSFKLVKLGLISWQEKIKRARSNLFVKKNTRAFKFRFDMVSISASFCSTFLVPTCVCLYLGINFYRPAKGYSLLMLICFCFLSCIVSVFSSFSCC